MLQKHLHSLHRLDNLSSLSKPGPKRKSDNRHRDDASPVDGKLLRLALIPSKRRDGEESGEKGGREERHGEHGDRLHGGRVSASGLGKIFARICHLDVDLGVLVREEGEELGRNIVSVCAGTVRSLVAQLRSLG